MAYFQLARSPESTIPAGAGIVLLLLIDAVGLTHPYPRIAEHAHPSAVFTPVIGIPGVLHGAEYPLGVRHHDGDAAVAGGQTGDATRGAVGVGWVTLGHAATVIDVT